MRACCVLLCLFASACATGSAASARALAEQELSCGADDLRVVALGEIVVDPRAPLTLTLHDAEGCSAQSLLWCRRDGGVHCAATPAELVSPAHAAAAERALHLRRTASRARCAPDTVRVTQESESLWRYEACDGTRDYHCRATGCEGLSRR